MGREPRQFTVWSWVVEVARDRFVVSILAQALDLHGPEELLRESAVADNRGDANRMQVEMLRALCERLELQGHRVVDVNAGMAPPNP
jgi:hypothetical protein